MEQYVKLNLEEYERLKNAEVAIKEKPLFFEHREFEICGTEDAKARIIDECMYELYEEIAKEKKAQNLSDEGEKNVLDRVLKWFK